MLCVMASVEWTPLYTLRKSYMLCTLVQYVEYKFDVAVFRMQYALYPMDDDRGSGISWWESVYEHTNFTI